MAYLCDLGSLTSETAAGACVRARAQHCGQYIILRPSFGVDSPCKERVPGGQRTIGIEGRSTLYFALVYTEQT